MMTWIGIILLIGAAGAGAALPELPRVFLDTTYSAPAGNVITVNAGGNLQTAINNAACGDIISVQAGATFTGQFTLPNKACAGWIYIQSSAYSQLPAPGTRVGPAQAGLMPKLTGNWPIIKTAPGAHHYRFVGIEVQPLPGALSYAHIFLGENSSPSNRPHHFVFDRMYIHGDPAVGGMRGFILESQDTAVIDSYISDFKHQANDTQGILGCTGEGPFKIANNYLEAAGENVMFGGCGANTNVTPSDIEIRGNHFFKPLSWKANDPSFQGTRWLIKNLLELKHARRVLVEGNIFGQHWGGQGQTGFAIVLTVRGEGYMTWAPVEDIIIRKNIVRNTGQGLIVTGADDSGVSAGGQRMLIQDNLWQIDSSWSVGGSSNGEFLQISMGADDITFDHNSVFQNGSIMWAEAVNQGFVFRNMIINMGSYGITSSLGGGSPTINAAFPGIDFTKNVIIDPQNQRQYYGSYVAANFWPSNAGSVGFVNYSGGDYRLLASSPYKNAGTDGKDIGADIDAINAATACSISGICGAPPPPAVTMSPARPRGLRLQ